jgi:hypothetical protein
MSEVVRLCRYKSLLCSRTAVSADDLMATQEVSAKKIDKALGTDYGYCNFNGAALSWAKLRCAARYRRGFGRRRRGMFSRFCRNESRKKEARV